jgi:Flp pilus assembly protein TadB
MSRKAAEPGAIALADYAEHVDRADYERHAQSQGRPRALLWWSLVALAVASGYAIGLVAEMWIGVLVALALLPVAVRVLFAWDRARLLRRFPELEGADTHWPRARDWIVGKESTVEPRD